jgi:hypothetical protein
MTSRTSPLSVTCGSCIAVDEREESMDATLWRAVVCRPCSPHGLAPSRSRKSSSSTLSGYLPSRVGRPHPLQSSSSPTLPPTSPADRRSTVSPAAWSCHASTEVVDTPGRGSAVSEEAVCRALHAAWSCPASTEGRWRWLPSRRNAGSR